MPTPMSNVLGTQRRVTYPIYTSNAAFPIPTWAQGGKGVMYVTGCAGGGSDGSAGAGGGKAGAGAFAVDHPIPIPSGITTANIQIGAGASAPLPDFNGNSGGTTSITLGSTTPLSLGGGGGGSASGGSGGILTVYGAALNTQNPLTSSSPATVTDVNNALNLYSRLYPFYKTLSFGMAGAAASNPPAALTNNNGITPFGSPTAGYGAGGPTGRPGFLLVTFVEGL